MKPKLEWTLRAKMPAYRRHLRDAIDAVHHAMTRGKWVISWSTGKDSTAMTHLIRSCYPDTPIMIQFDDCDWPEKRAYAERVAAAQGWDYHAVEPDFSVWERAKSYAIGMDDLCSPSHAFTQDTFLYVLEAKRRDLGCIGTFLGLRAEESRARKMNILKRGELYQLKSGEWRCYPLGRWTAEDVFAYLTEQEVEINPCYFYNRFRQPEDIRLCYALPTPTGIRYGDMQHLRHYYPQQFQRLREEGLV